MPIEIDKIMRLEEIQRIGVDHMSDEQRQALIDWGFRMYDAGRYVVGDIQEVKYDGRLVILDDGSRWEVDAADATTADMWGLADKIVIIDGEMYKLDIFEKVLVQEEL